MILSLLCKIHSYNNSCISYIVQTLFYHAQLVLELLVNVHKPLKSYLDLLVRAYNNCQSNRIPEV